MSDERLHQRAQELMDANRKEIEDRLAQAKAAGQTHLDPPVKVLSWRGAYLEATWQLWREGEPA